MITWEHLSKLRIPSGVVLVAIAAIVSAAWAVFAWADDIEDTQLQTALQIQATQTQLDQLVLLVTQAHADNAGNHREMLVNLARVERSVNLLRTRIDVNEERRRFGTGADIENN